MKEREKESTSFPSRAFTCPLYLCAHNKTVLRTRKLSAWLPLDVRARGGTEGVTLGTNQLSLPLSLHLSSVFPSFPPFTLFLSPLPSLSRSLLSSFSSHYSVRSPSRVRATETSHKGSHFQIAFMVVWAPWGRCLWDTLGSMEVDLEQPGSLRSSSLTFPTLIF